MNIFKIIFRFFGYLSIEDIQKELEFSEYQIGVIKKENEHYRELIRKEWAGSAIFDDLRHNCKLLPFYEKEVEKWRKKLNKRKK